jgi:hypothetical protein
VKTRRKESDPRGPRYPSKDLAVSVRHPESDEKEEG